MDIFKLKPGDRDYYTLTEEIYFTQTQRRPPYTATAQSGKALYLAVCPDCGNAIEIRNIGPVEGENKHHPGKPFGKHYKLNIPGLLTYNQARYDQCSLRGEVSIGAKMHRSNDEFNKEILRLVVEHADVIRTLLAPCMGVTVGAKLFESVIEEFVSRESYKSAGVQPANLPYAIAFWSENQNLWGQVVNDNYLIAAINADKAGWFQVGADCRIQSTPQAPFGAQIRFHFPSHKKGDLKTGEANTITLAVGRYPPNEVRGEIFFRKTLEYRNSDFLEAVEKERRHQDDNAKARRAKWTNIARQVVMKHRPDALANGAEAGLR